MKDIVFAGGFFEYPKNIFGHFVTFVKKVQELKLDSYDIFEFKVGNLTQENVMVKLESVKGDGSESKPIEFDLCLCVISIISLYLLIIYKCY